MMTKRYTLGNIALSLAALGFCGLFLCGNPRIGYVGAYLALSGPVAVVLGLIGRFRSGERSAYWAMILGTFVSLYLPTLFLNHPFLRRDSAQPHAGTTVVPRQAA